MLRRFLACDLLPGHPGRKGMSRVGAEKRKEMGGRSKTRRLDCGQRKESLDAPLPCVRSPTRPRIRNGGQEDKEKEEQIKKQT